MINEPHATTLAFITLGLLMGELFAQKLQYAGNMRRALENQKERVSTCHGTNKTRIYGALSPSSHVLAVDEVAQTSSIGRSGKQSNDTVLGNGHPQNTWHAWPLGLHDPVDPGYLGNIELF